MLTRFEVVGGNATIHGQHLCISSDGKIHIAAPSKADDDKIALAKPIGSSPGVLAVVSTTASGQEHSTTSTNLFYCLEGSSGKGSYRLSARSDDSTFGMGWQVKRDGWEVVDDEGMTGRHLLRWNEKVRANSWLAVKASDVEGEAGRWEVWLIAPNAANMDDFEEYKLIDIVAVEVDGAGRDVE
ncbi:uncharacterized protein AB675_8298 [Cyphellophora attinorum]|uniref:Uncharacterized protein n=1 Tax=Cyphellophora attinorum TaxID=1664694 RepID=A0A0N1P213_9EURO|nr:uncharacterized protein AB675_8298 [Phialophora attinorum]KPI44486.1 hypothetical protein AB675_8298 [Phialophora attinorum]